MRTVNIKRNWRPLDVLLHWIYPLDPPWLMGSHLTQPFHTNLIYDMFGYSYSCIKWIFCWLICYDLFWNITLTGRICEKMFRQYVSRSRWKKLLVQSWCCVVKPELCCLNQDFCAPSIELPAAYPLVSQLYDPYGSKHCPRRYCERSKSYPKHFLRWYLDPLGW